MTAKQRKYFGKRKTRTVYIKTKRRKRVGVMAKRRGGFSRGRRGFGSMGGMLSPVLSGIADNVIDSYSPIDGIGSLIVGGFLMKNETMKNLGLYKIGFSAGNFLPIPRGGGASAGGFS